MSMGYTTRQTVRGLDGWIMGEGHCDAAQHSKMRCVRKSHCWVLASCGISRTIVIRQPLCAGFANLIPESNCISIPDKEGQNVRPNQFMLLLNGLRVKFQCFPPTFLKADVVSEFEALKIASRGN